MKLIRFVAKGSTLPIFGIVIADKAVAFSVLQSKSGITYDFLSDSTSYLSNLPESEQAAHSLFKWGEQHLNELGEVECFTLDSVRLLAPIEVKAIFDFGLTPQHLKNSYETLMEYEKDNPLTGPILQAIAKSMLANKDKNLETKKEESLSYYKCNMNSIVGDDVTIPWPLYTARLDIEPELAVVYGNASQPVAGFCIFNDISARDVQAPEFLGGFCFTKDMESGNQLGPYLVTPDEVGDAYNLEVNVAVNGKARFKGSTSEISHQAEAIFEWIEKICPFRTGTVVGFGTIPGCTGLDFDDFLDPGDLIEITMDKLGTLNCRFDKPKASLGPSRWPIRASLQKYIS
jgi:2-keto-4-pentenoate hydratase/2-oxohepta-3-ene-1,7-dioic acid hydratase in catechol pathway